jgi:hypothetical protein
MSAAGGSADNHSYFWHSCRALPTLNEDLEGERDPMRRLDRNSGGYWQNGLAERVK